MPVFNFPGRAGWDWAQLNTELQRKAELEKEQKEDKRQLQMQKVLLLQQLAEDLPCAASRRSLVLSGSCP